MPTSKKERSIMWVKGMSGFMTRHEWSSALLKYHGIFPSRKWEFWRCLFKASNKSTNNYGIMVVEACNIDSNVQNWDLPTPFLVLRRSAKIGNVEKCWIIQSSLSTTIMTHSFVQEASLQSYCISKCNVNAWSAL